MPRTPKLLSDGDALLAWSILVLSFAAYLQIFLPLIPAGGKAMGNDYTYYLPSLLSGYYWFLNNGPAAVPWFSPAQCGGLPYFADFNAAYFSFPQWATFAAGPVAAVRATFALFAGLGAIGCYLLLRARFAVAPAAAAAAAVLFLFSGFHTYRMAAGHLTFHPYALTPWLAWAVLAPAPAPAVAGRVERLCATAWPSILGALIVTYMFQAGMIHALPVSFVAVAVMLLVHGQIHGHRARPWILLTIVALTGCALSASQIAAALAFLGNFPRSHYPLPAFTDPLALLATAAAALFWRVSPEAAAARMQGVMFTLNSQEWEYGLGPAALVLLAAGAMIHAWQSRKAPRPLSAIARSLPAWSAIAIALALPLALNWYEARWNDWLKSLPYFGSSSNLLRWFALYIPVAALLAGLALHRIAPGARGGLAGAAIVAVATVGWNAAADKTYYARQSYDGTRIEAAWREAQSSGRVPAVSQIVDFRREPGPERAVRQRNDALTRGASQLPCYQPIFGYRLEKFPVGPLRPGPALAEVVPGVLNVKNPACYLFPDDNACKPGEHFAAGRRDDAKRFLAYEPFPFVRPLSQRAAGLTTLVALILVTLLTAGSVYYALRRALTAR